MVNSILIGLLWLSVVVPPLVDGTIYPDGLEHYTTLIVQGFDLGLLLPIGFISGYMLTLKNPEGFVYATVYIVFLSILMSALTAKLIAMSLNDVNVIPAIFIIPVINGAAIVGAMLMILSIDGRDGASVYQN